MAKKLTKREVDAIYRLRLKIDKLAEKYDPWNGHEDIPLGIEGNGTVYDNLSGASCSLDMILQEYL